MTEKPINKEKIITTKKPNKKYYRPKKKKEDIEIKLDPHTNTFTNETTKYFKTLKNLKNIEDKKIVGKYIIKDSNNFSIKLNTKPCWIHRKIMKLFFGINWVDKIKKNSI